MTALDVRWVSIFADVPAAHLATAQAFWTAATDTSAGLPAGDQDEFIPLEPRAGDRFLWLQRVSAGPGGWHPDLHVPDPSAAAAAAGALGAEQISATEELVVLATPAGQAFCLVREDGGQPRRRPRPAVWDGRRSLADQLCLDIPAATFEADLDFWAALTGWPQGRTDVPEFARLNPPGRLPVQFLLQRLGPDDHGGARAHLDLSADNRTAEASRHEDLGAEVLRTAEGWTTLRDPAGLIYCVTARAPGQPPR